MGLMTKIRKRHIALMERTCDVLGNVLQTVTQEAATTLRDSDDGWTILEVVCHMRDYEEIFHERAQTILQEEYPLLPAHDHEAMAVEREYNKQNLAQAYADLKQARQRFTEFFKTLPDPDWERAGMHPEEGHYTMTDAVMHVSRHDLTHIEQITRILAQAKEKQPNPS
jgi:uncharacterized damage-inducible protein DinB